MSTVLTPPNLSARKLISHATTKTPAMVSTTPAICAQFTRSRKKMKLATMIRIGIAACSIETLIAVV